MKLVLLPAARSSATRGNGYRENVINGNTAGTVNGGTNMGNNVCTGMTTCP